MTAIIWSELALEELDALVSYVGERNPQAADALYERIESSVMLLANWPYLFREGRVEGTREIVAHPNYIVVYRVLESHVEIINVIHARREYP
jgi:toxin ParE1/3/4